MLLCNMMVVPGFIPETTAANSRVHGQISAAASERLVLDVQMLFSPFTAGTMSHLGLFLCGDGERSSETLRVGPSVPRSQLHTILLTKPLLYRHEACLVVAIERFLFWNTDFLNC